MEMLVEIYKKPVAAVIFSEAVEIDYLKRHYRVPIFTSPENAMRAFHLSHTWASRKHSPHGIHRATGPAAEKTKNMLDAVKGRRDLYLNEAMELIRQYGFSTPPYFLCRSAEEALQVWKTLNGPVAMKVVQPHISHKTDQGMIRLNLNSDEEISSTFAALCREVPHEDLEVMIQPIISEGREVMLGGKQDQYSGELEEII